jgi:hypothetical protein
VGGYGLGILGSWVTGRIFNIVMSVVSSPLSVVEFGVQGVEGGMNRQGAREVARGPWSPPRRASCGQLRQVFKEARKAGRGMEWGMGNGKLSGPTSATGNHVHNDYSIHITPDCQEGIGHKMW